MLCYADIAPRRARFSSPRRSNSDAGSLCPAATAQLEALAESYGMQLTDAQNRLREHVATHEPSDEAAKKADEIDAQIQRRSKGGVLV